MITRQLAEKKKKRHKMALAFLFPFMWLWAVVSNAMKPPIYRNGIHAVTGITGSGKTLLMHKIALYYLARGYTVYSNSRFNSAVKYLEIDDYFGEFEQKKPLENCIVIFDEIQYQFNKRQNRRNDYNEIFIPMIEWLTTHRHQGVPKVYFITQSYNQLDLQFQNLIHRVHMVFSKSYPDFKIWLRDEKFGVKFRPYKIKYYSKPKTEIDKDDIQKYILKNDKQVYQKSVKRGQVRYKKTVVYTEKITLETLLCFNTYAFKRVNYEKSGQEKDN